MDIRQAEIRKRKIILLSLIFTFGFCLFILIGTLMASEIVATGEIKIPEKSWYENFGDLDTVSIGVFESSYPELKNNFEHTIGTIYLTFDDGPGEYTAKLLDILKKYNVKATFFVTGYGDDAIIQREHDEGHTVALHTFSHKYNIVYSSVENYFNDLSQIADRVKRITGEDSKIIRFPGGSSNTVSAKYDGPIRIMSVLSQEVLARGYVYFDWNVDSNDAGNINSADTVYENVVTRLREGANVVLQHDIKGFSVDAVERIIEYGLANGYDFKALSMDSPAIRHGINN